MSHSAEDPAENSGSGDVGIQLPSPEQEVLQAEKRFAAFYGLTKSKALAIRDQAARIESEETRPEDGLNGTPALYVDRIQIRRDSGSGGTQLYNVSAYRPETALPPYERGRALEEHDVLVSGLDWHSSLEVNTVKLVRRDAGGKPTHKEVVKQSRGRYSYQVHGLEGNTDYTQAPIENFAACASVINEAVDVLKVAAVNRNAMAQAPFKAQLETMQQAADSVATI